jgi:hypothetical protein
MIALPITLNRNQLPWLISKPVPLSHFLKDIPVKKLFLTSVATIASLAIGLAFSASAQAQAWPAKTVSVVVPFPPGGSTDTVARAISPRLTEKLGQSFIVDNKAGATGNDWFNLCQTRCA